MIDIELNGKTLSVTPGISLNELLHKERYTKNSFAVAVNESFVPRSQYETIKISAGDRIEILTAMQGG